MSKDPMELVSVKMKRLVDEASQVRYIPGGALKIYFRSANTLLRQVSILYFLFFLGFFEFSRNLYYSQGFIGKRTTW